MYIRKTATRSAKGKTYYTCRLVETMRTATGKVRQLTLLNLGTAYDAVSQDEWSMLTGRVKDILIGESAPLLALDDHIECEAMRLVNLIIKKHGDEIFSLSDKTAHYEEVNLNTLESSDIRSIGAESLAYHTATKDLNLAEILKDCGFNDRQYHDALATIIGRLLYPGSDVATAEDIKTKSALDEVIGIDFSTLHKNRLYEISDLLLKHKEHIEEKLYEQEKARFQFEEVVTLYDLTNTYFEGQSQNNDNAALGRSKEKRSDCMLVTLALVLDGSGFPRKSHIFKGNVSEPTTLEEMVKLCSKEAIIVMDAGIATEENISWLTQHQYKYLVISRKRHLEIPESVDGVLVKEDKENKVTSFLLKNEETQESELYCHSEGMERKGGALYEKFRARFIEELQKLSDGLTKKGCTKKYDKVVERLGRLKQKYSKVARSFEVDIKADDKKEQAISITWKEKEVRSDKVKGIYCIRTNQMALSHHDIWNTYRMLNDIESAFRTLKTDLGLRPIYHQKTDRISGHIFISLLAYHVLHTIRFKLKRHDIHDSWETIRRKLGMHFRVTTSIQKKNGKIIHIRKTTRPSPEQASIYKACNAPAIPAKTIIKEF